ncbi:MAG: exodeoxyribonuclease VII large subunit, partial [bacterium]|nr:exodeoxyribonuclease VII large subunit [bacterium]
MTLKTSLDTFKQLPEDALSVTQLILSVKTNLESKYRSVKVIGEVSSFKAWRSGHWYFDLKDEESVLPAVMFKYNCSKVRFEVQDGMQVLITGRISVYAPQCKIQVMVESIEPIGAGALALAFEQLKNKLEVEGLFATTHKISLPTFPLCVGLVTSPQGAAVQDMLRILTNRMPMIKVLLAPVRVQGQGSANEISSAISQLDNSNLCDVIIVGRGGGSLEDLWSFNEEIVARAIYNCKTPIVSAVGHETDFSIADFVADIRCATPTHAAQMVVPDLSDITNNIEAISQKMHRHMKALLGQKSLQLEKIAKKIKEPRLVLLQLMQRVDEVAMKLERNLLNLFKRKKHALNQINLRLLKVSLNKKHAAEAQKLSVLQHRIQTALTNNLKKLQERTELNKAKLIALS